MTIIFPLLLLAVGSFLLINGLIKPVSPKLIFPRYNAEPSTGKRLWPLSAGALMTLSGLALLLSPWFRTP